MHITNLKYKYEELSVHCGVIAMSKLKSQGIMQFSIYIVEPIMQNAKQSVCNAKSKIQKASLQWKIEIRDQNSQFAMQDLNQKSKQPVCNAKSKFRDPNSQFAKSGIIALVGNLLGCQATNNWQGCLA